MQIFGVQNKRIFNPSPNHENGLHSFFSHLQYFMRGRRPYPKSVSRPPFGLFRHKSQEIDF